MNQNSFGVPFNLKVVFDEEDEDMSGLGTFEKGSQSSVMIQKACSLMCKRQT